MNLKDECDKTRNEVFDAFASAVQETKGYNQPHAFIILGASGDLAKKELYLTLWKLFRDNLLPKKILIVGYARSKLTIDQYLTEVIYERLKIEKEQECKFKEFISKNYYLSGSYDNENDILKLNSMISKLSKDNFSQDEGGFECNRIFYLAIPPSIYKPVTELLSLHCKTPKPYFTRLVVEKPFGKDLQTSNDLSRHLSKLFTEEEIYRIDHYLGKEMVQNLVVLRFANHLFQRVWNRDSIECVMITFKEPFGVKSRSGYFDEFGIIRDVMQNHLLQVVSLIAMESPVSKEAEEIRDEKVKVLRCMPEIKIEDVVIGQYVGNQNGTDEQKVGYLEEKNIPKESLTATFASLVLKIRNERWDGVPFIIKAGKALDEQKTEIRFQFKDVPGDIFDDSCVRNELVIRVQPNEAIYLKFSTKKPGMSFCPEETELDLTYKNRYKNIYMPDAYERLILDIFLGTQIHFVRTDELTEAWRIFTPILHKIEQERIRPIPYVFGSRSFKEADKLAEEKGHFLYTGTYKWVDSKKDNQSVNS